MDISNEQKEYTEQEFKGLNRKVVLPAVRQHMPDAPAGRRSHHALATGARLAVKGR